MTVFDHDLPAALLGFSAIESENAASELVRLENLREYVVLRPSRMGVYIFDPSHHMYHSEAFQTIITEAQHGEDFHLRRHIDYPNDDPYLQMMDSEEGNNSGEVKDGEEGKVKSSDEGKSK